MRVPQTGETLGRYRLDRVIGQGGMAVVFAATDLRLDRTVALKVITGAFADSPDFQRRFHAEAAALAKLDSPFVTPIHDHDEVDGVLFIATQYVDGTDLATAIRRQGALPPRIAFEMVAQVARGLGDAHRKGIVHRDVKPSNVLIRNPGTPDAHAYLCDFGVARQPDGEQLTATGSVTGTWGYLAPEVIQGQPASVASDIYALGCVLWTCLTGNPPYSGTDTQIMLAHVNNPVPQLPGNDRLTQELNALLARMLAKKPADRPADAAEVRAALEQLARHAGDGALLPAPPTPPTAVRPRAKRSRLPLLVGVGAAVLVLVAGVVAWTRLGDEPAHTKADEPSAGSGVAGDVDGDGYGDLVLQQNRAGYPATPIAEWTVPSTGTAFGTADRAPAVSDFLHPADVDGDGRPESVWIKNDLEGAFRVSVVSRDGVTREQQISVTEEQDIARYATMVADATGDGKDDLILLGTPSDLPEVLYVAASDGTGFADPVLWWRGEQGTEGYYWAGDFTGDGRSDVLRFQWIDEQHGKEKHAQLLTAGNDEFVSGSLSKIPGPGHSAVIAPWLIGDVDGDGADEITVVKGGRQSIDVFEMTAQGLGDPVAWRTWNLSLEQARKYARTGTKAYWVLIDVDGDGRSDLVTLEPPRSQQMQIRVRTSDGKAFGDPEVWGAMPCGEECKDSFEPVG